MGKPILCLDFDGVVHEYKHPWTNAWTISDHVTAGFFDWAEEAREYFRLVIYSARSSDPNGVMAMRIWLAYEYEEWISHNYLGPKFADFGFEFASEKPKAFLTIDDRALPFNGNWRHFDPQGLLQFKPWNYQEKEEGVS